VNLLPLTPETSWEYCGDVYFCPSFFVSGLTHAVGCINNAQIVLHFRLTFLNLNEILRTVGLATGYELHG
jgi:hypothetical protein